MYPGRTHGLILFGLITLSGCSTNLSDYAKLDKLRVLTLKADTPEVGDTGATVHVTPYISDINGNGRTLTYSYQTCPDPGIAYGAQPSCNSAPSSPITFGPLGTSNQTYTGAGPSLAITIPTGFLSSSKQPLVPNQFNGVAYLVVYTVTSTDQSSSVTAFKRIMVSTNPNKNSNPSISTVLSGSSSLSIIPSTSSYPSGQTNLGVTVSSGSSETYQTQNTDGSLSSGVETLVTTWFYSDGSTQSDRAFVGSVNSWTPPSPPPSARSSVLAVLVRDGRGGEDIAQVEFK